MKRMLFGVLLCLLCIFMILSGCKKNSPSSPGENATATFVQTSTISPTFTVSQTFTDTATITQTHTASATATYTSTVTPVPTVSYAGFAAVPGATFYQTDGVTGFNHTVSSFQMAKYEVTYELWYDVYRWALLHGYYFTNAGREGHDGTAGAAPTSSKFEPVTSIDWRDMVAWCNAYSQKAGLVPAYYVDYTLTTPLKNISEAGNNPGVDWTASGYRLPTEGEWMLAASYKDGTSWTPYNYCSGAAADVTDTAEVSAVAWYLGNSGNVTHIAGTKNSNALGIYDMSGNVYELCWDLHASAYPADMANYRGAASGINMVIKGMSFLADQQYMYIGNRYWITKYVNATAVGFRVARSN